MQEQLWAILLALLLITAGCGKGDGDGTEAPPPSTDNTEEVTEAPEAPTDEGAEAFDDDVFDATPDSLPVDESGNPASEAVQQILTKAEVQEIARGRFERGLEKIPPFDRKAAAHKLMLDGYEVNMDEFPEKPLSPKELRDLFMSGLKLKADEQYPPEDRAHVVKQAAEQFPLYEKGDKIRLVLVRGVVEGIVEEMYGDRIKVDGRHVLIRDIQQPSPEAFDVPRIEKRRKHYVSLNFDQPRQRYIAEMDEKQREAFYKRHFYVKGKSGWLRADQLYSKLLATEAAKLERQYVDEQRFLLRKKIEQELRDEGLWR
jgi:hypothetical protein